MADFDSSLPIRTENAGDAIVKIADATLPSQQLAVEADGSINVNADISATDLDIRDLVFATDKVDVSGSSVTVSATDLDVRDLTFASDSVDVSGSSVTVSATDLDIRDLDFASDSVDVSGSSVTVTATDLDVRDLTHVSDSIRVGDGTDFLAVNSDGSINVVPQEDPGTERVNYNTAAALAADATSNHDFTPTNASKLFQVWAAASGKLKIEVQVETAAASSVFNTIAVGFNSTANPNIDLRLAKYAAVPAGARVRVIRTNTDKAAQDVYSTIVALES